MMNPRGVEASLRQALQKGAAPTVVCTLAKASEGDRADGRRYVDLEPPLLRLVEKGCPGRLRKIKADHEAEAA